MRQDATHAAQTSRVRRSGQNGFALLEVVVALALLTVIAALIPSTIVSARDASRRAENWLHARLIADRIIHERLSGQLRPGTWGGMLDGMRWRISAIPRGRATAATAEKPPRTLLEIHVVVEMTASDRLVLTTARIGAPR